MSVFAWMAVGYFAVCITCLAVFAVFDVLYKRRCARHAELVQRTYDEGVVAGTAAKMFGQEIHARNLPLLPFNPAAAKVERERVTSECRARMYARGVLYGFTAADGVDPVEITATVAKLEAFANGAGR